MKYLRWPDSYLSAGAALARLKRGTDTVEVPQLAFTISPCFTTASRSPNSWVVIAAAMKRDRLRGPKANDSAEALLRTAKNFDIARRMTDRIESRNFLSRAARKARRLHEKPNVALSAR